MDQQLTQSLEMSTQVMQKHANVNNILHSILSEEFNTCPLCKSTLQWYKINLNTQFLMCGNVNCTYVCGPEMKFEKVYPLMENEEEVCRQAGEDTVELSVPPPTLSINESQYSTKASISKGAYAPSVASGRSTKSVASYLSNKSIKIEVEKAQKLTEDMIKKKVKKARIVNPIYLKHLMDLQKRSQFQLLTESELKTAETIANPITDSNFELSIQLPTDDAHFVKVDLLQK